MEQRRADAVGKPAERMGDVVVEEEDLESKKEHRDHRTVGLRDAAASPSPQEPGCLFLPESRTALLAMVHVTWRLMAPMPNYAKQTRGKSQCFFRGKLSKRGQMLVPFTPVWTSAELPLISTGISKRRTLPRTRSASGADSPFKTQA